MKEWWQWSPAQGSERLGFAIIGVGRFGIAVCRELLQNGADVLAVDRSERAVDELRQVEPSVEARVVDCTDEEALREAGVLEICLLYTSPSPRDLARSRMPSSA